MTDYEQFPRYLPHQIKSVQIIEKTNDYTITEETLHLSSVISKTFVQQTKHYSFSDNLLKSEILSGPAKNSTIEITIDEKNSIKSKWLENSPYGISFKIREKKGHSDKYIAISLHETGRIEYKIQWKEVDKANVDDIKDTYIHVKKLIGLNGIRCFTKTNLYLCGLQPMQCRISYKKWEKKTFPI